MYHEVWVELYTITSNPRKEKTGLNWKPNQASRLHASEDQESNNLDGLWKIFALGLGDSVSTTDVFYFL